MFPYELAKELKDSGFPLQKEIHRGFVNYGGAEKREDIFIDIPTLSELIEACGEEFAGLNYTYGEVEKREWEARSVMKNTHGKYPINQFWAKSSTPEEAVARLWLAINNKNS